MTEFIYILVTGFIHFLKLSESKIQIGICDPICVSFEVLDMKKSGNHFI